MFRSFHKYVVAGIVLGVSTACSSSGSFVTLAQLGPVSAGDSVSTKVIAGDQISIQVWNSPQLSTKQRVRDDGTVSIFFVDNLKVAGLTTREVAAEVARHLQGVLVAPQVWVVVEESAANVINVTGEVTRPGIYPINSSLSVLDAITMASGLTEFAKRDRIFVLRTKPVVMRIRLSYDDLKTGEDAKVGFRLKAGDAVIVE